jgi:hypothetical protein
VGLSGVVTRERSEVAVYCEHCGLKIFPERSICTRCGRVPLHEWVQLIGLAILFLAALANSVASLFLLPKLSNEHPSVPFFRDWLWVDRESSLYGWIPLAAALLLWEYSVWRKIRKAKPVPKIKRWVSRKILTFVLAAGFAPVLPWWVPANQPSDRTLAAISQYPGLPCAISWGGVLLVAVVLSVKAETRDCLLGRGKTLSLVGLGAVTLFIMLTLYGWSLI